MLGEYFIDQCLTAATSLQATDKSSKDILDSMYYILRWYKKETPRDDFPIEFTDKYDLALYISKYRVENKKFDFEAMAQGMSAGRFSDLIPVLRAKQRDFSEEDRNDLFTAICNKRKLCELISGKKDILQKLNDIESGMYSDDVELINEWELIVHRLNNQLMEVNRMEALEDVSFIDVLNDDYTPVMEKLRDQSDYELSIKTGFRFLYDSLPAGGFEPCRLYLIGGTSGVGKSTILVNFLGNAVLKSQRYDPFVQKNRDMLIYITAENLIDESLERLYCMLTGIPVAEVKEKYMDDNFTLQTKLVEIMQQRQMNIQIYYVQPKKTTVRDIEAIIDKVQSTGCNVKGLYIDYLDLIRSGYQLTDLRHELGEVAIGFKNIAVTYRIPVVTVTQLNRGGYDSKSEPTLTQMSESMQKIDNSDFVLFLQNDQEPTIGIPTELGIPKQCKHIKMTILKNRNGPVQKSSLMIMQEKLGSEEIFNFRIEEKGNLDNSVSLGGQKNDKDQDAAWATF